MPASLRQGRPLSPGRTRARLRPSLVTRLRRVQLLLCDVDGVMTDGSLFLGPGGEFKQYHAPDGLGLVLLRRHGVRVGWISARPSPATEVRAAELKIDFLAQTKEGKVSAVEAILKQAGLKWEQVCYVGDDIVDLGPLRHAGAAIAPANAGAEARSMAHYVTAESGGHGAVRTVTEMILKAQGKWPGILAGYAG